MLIFSYTKLIKCSYDVPMCSFFYIFKNLLFFGGCIGISKNTILIILFFSVHFLPKKHSQKKVRNNIFFFKKEDFEGILQKDGKKKGVNGDKIIVNFFVRKKHTIYDPQGCRLAFKKNHE